MTLRVDLFGDFGYHDLYKQFEKAHPGVTIKEDIESYADHHANLAKHLATGAGADDVVAIEVGFIAQFKAQPAELRRPQLRTAPRSSRASGFPGSGRSRSHPTEHRSASAQTSAAWASVTAVI